MKVRKKWRLKKYPSFTTESAPSMRKAYERVESLRQDYAAGAGRVHHVNVEVYEDSGEGWSLYERIVFPAVAE